MWASDQRDALALMALIVVTLPPMSVGPKFPDVLRAFRSLGQLQEDTAGHHARLPGNAPTGIAGPGTVCVQIEMSKG